MVSKPMWMVRAAEGGVLVDQFIEKGVVAIGWPLLRDLNQYRDKDEMVAALKNSWPEQSPGNWSTSASQCLRFRDELDVGDFVVTYDPGRRVYHLGTITSDYKHVPDIMPDFENVRDVQWQSEIERDRLSTATRNSLGAIMTLFRLPDAAAREIEAAAKGQPNQESIATTEQQPEDELSILKQYREAAVEFVKDRISRLDDREMEELVAGLLRAMGYKTRVSEPGADRGVDILASPDGFGFESPRIVVEVKHRPNTAMGSQAIRTFLGGRHQDDKGLYVSTGGFSKDARYEAERAKIPLMLMDLDGLVKALMEHYEDTDSRTRALAPLTRTYWPI